MQKLYKCLEKVHKQKEDFPMKHLSQKRYGIFLVLFFILMVGVTLFIHNKLILSKKVHYHAGFVIFQNNKKLNFSNMKYMYTKLCTVSGKEDEYEDDQLEKAHLHDNIGDVVHVERNGAIWKDLFTNIHFSIEYGKTTGYINGKKVENYQFHTIQPDNSLVVFIGNSDIVKNLQIAPTKKYIQKMAKKSKTCGD